MRSNGVSSPNFWVDQTDQASQSHVTFRVLVRRNERGVVRSTHARRRVVRRTTLMFFDNMQLLFDNHVDRIQRAAVAGVASVGSQRMLFGFEVEGTCVQKAWRVAYC